MKKLEINSGFLEGKNAKVKNFFRSGKIDTWKTILSKKQTNQIENAFRNEMIEMNYI